MSRTGRPPEHRIKVQVNIKPETKAKLDRLIDKSVPAVASKGRVVDTLIAAANPLTFAKE